MQLDGTPSRYISGLPACHFCCHIADERQSEPCCIASIVGLQVVVTRTVEGPIVRSTYAEVHERARLCALALRRLGITQGDRVATLAWNTCRHLESWSVLFCSLLPEAHAWAALPCFF